jgi:opacity protein-like surface antigen
LAPFRKPDDDQPEDSLTFPIRVFKNVYSKARHMMRKTVVFLSVLFIAAAAAYPQLISFKLNAGLTWINGDDYNQGIAGRNQYIRDTTSTMSGAYKELTSGVNLSGEIIVHTKSAWAVGFGGGYYHLGNESTVTGQGLLAGALFDFSSTFKPKISVIPMYVNLHFVTRLAPKANLDLYAGPLFQVVQFTFENPSTLSINSVNQTVTYTASQTSFGFQAGLGLSYDIMNGVALIVDGCYRNGKVTNLMGNWAALGTSATGAINNSSAEYYAWAYDYSPAGKYFLLDFFDNNGPSGDFVANARKAEIRLSGITASAGLKIHF